MPPTLTRGSSTSTAVPRPRAGAIPAPRSIEPLPADYWTATRAPAPRRRDPGAMLAIALLIAVAGIVGLFAGIAAFHAGSGVLW